MISHSASRSSYNGSVSPASTLTLPAPRPVWFLGHRASKGGPLGNPVHELRRHALIRAAQLADLELLMDDVGLPPSGQLTQTGPFQTSGLRGEGCSLQEC